MKILRSVPVLLLLLLLGAPTLAGDEDAETLAPKVRDYPTKFRLIRMGPRALPPLVGQAGSEDASLAFESRSAARWIVYRAAGDAEARREVLRTLEGLAERAEAPAVRAFVAELLGDIGAVAVATLARLLDDAAPAVREQAVLSLARIEDAAAGRALAEAMDDASLRDLLFPALALRSEPVCLARLLEAAQAGAAGAIRALGRAGPSREADAELLRLAKQGSAPARESLRTRGERLGNPYLLVHALELAADEAERREVLRALGRVPPRGEAPPEALLAAEGDPALARVAVRALLAWAERNPGPRATEELTRLLGTLQEEDLLTRALAAWGSAAAGAGPRPLGPHLASPSARVRGMAIAVLRDIPGAEATEALVEACAAERDPDVLGLAIRSLGERGDPAGARALEPFLLEGPEAVRRAAGEAYVTLAEHSSEADARAMYLKALGAGARGVALEGLARVGDESVLDALAAELRGATPENRARAADALTAIGERLEAAGRRAGAIDAWHKALNAGAAVENRLRLLGERIEITAREGRVSAWWILGPFPAADQETWTESLGPEEGVDLAAPGPGGRRWIPVQVGGDDAAVDLDGMLHPNDRVVAYAYAEIVSRKARDVVLKMGSDDGIRCWVNGKLVHEKLVPRGLTVDEDVVKVRLEEGVNRLLLKVCELGGGWGFALGIEDDQGRPLKFRIQ